MPYLFLPGGRIEPRQPRNRVVTHVDGIHIAPGVTHIKTVSEPMGVHWKDGIVFIGDSMIVCETTVVDRTVYLRAIEDMDYSSHKLFGHGPCIAIVE